MNKQQSDSPRQGVPTNGHIVILVALLVGAIVYALDAAIRALLYQQGSVLDQLIRPGALALTMRLYVAGLFLALVAIAYRLWRRERISAEQARTAESFLRSVVDNIPNMVFIKDARELRFVRVNPAGERLLGLTEQELIGKSDHDFFPPAQADFFTRKDRNVLESGCELDIPEEEIDTKRMGRRILHTKKVPIVDSAGRPAFLLGVAEDVTDSRRAELGIKTEKARAEHYLQISRAMIVGFDLDGKINLINPRGCEILCRSESEILGQNWFEMVFPERSKAREIQLARDIIAGNRKPEGLCANEILNKDGDIRHMAWNVALQHGPDGEVVGTLCSGQDVSDRVQAEIEAQRHHLELAHVMRLSTLGEMASGMAHELNQPLTAAITYCGAAVSMMEQKSSSPAEITDILKKVMEQAQRAGDIIWRLQTLVRKGSTHKELVDLDQIIRGVISFVEWELRNNRVEVDLRLCGECASVIADSVQMEQVLINLVRNSLDSIQSGAVTDGKITVSTCVTQQATIQTTVSDNGPGIAPSVLARLFEPFQTTKNNGIGIGLSISQSIIEAHGGKMWGESPATGGATFGLELPVAVASLQKPDNL